MKLYNLLNLKQEPFSNAPDPDMFFQSRQHMTCLQKVELGIHMRRGLSVVVGQVGAGKTTICRQLIRRLAKDEETETHLIMDPDYRDQEEFLAAMSELFCDEKPAEDAGNIQIKESIKKRLFTKNVEQRKKVVLIIDEGQKIPGFGIELLREFLNYETNEAKMLQIVIFAQTEFKKTLEKHQYFKDRVSVYNELKPLSFNDTSSMIRFRLLKAADSGVQPDLFTMPALWAIYQLTGGHPRQVVNLCHLCLMTVIIKEKTRVTWSMVHNCSRQTAGYQARMWRRVSVLLAVCLLLVVVGAFMFQPNLKALIFNGDAAKSDPAPTTATSAPQHPAAANVSPAANVKPPVGDEPPTPSPAQVDMAEIQTVAAESTAPADTITDVSMPPAEDKPLVIVSPEEMNVEIPEEPVVADVETTQPESKPEEPAETVESKPEPAEPRLLGKVTVRTGDNLSRLIKWVYGTYDMEYQTKVMAANPKLKDPTRLFAGMALQMPGIPADIEIPQGTHYWVELGRTNDLEKAVSLFRQAKGDSPPLSVVPFLKNGDLQFAVLMLGYYDSEANAKIGMMQLPPSVASKAKVVSIWENATQYFADPFRKPKP